MHDGTRRRGRPGWGLPRRRPASPGASWAGEGQQARREPPVRGRGRRGIAVVAVGLLLGGGALLLARGSDEQAVPVPDRSEEEATEVEPGTCLASLPSDARQPLEVVPCEQQHLGEVVAVTELGDGAWPGEVAVLVQARERCTEAFEQWVGLPLTDSELGLLPVVPRENDWRVDGDRTVVCLAEGPALVGSVRGTAR